MHGHYKNIQNRHNCVILLFRQHTPQSSTENFCVEFLLVLADLRSVTLRSNVGWVHVHHRTLPVVFSFEWITFTACCMGRKKKQCQTIKLWCFVAFSTWCDLLSNALACVYIFAWQCVALLTGALWWWWYRDQSWIDKGKEGGGWRWRGVFTGRAADRLNKKNKKIIFIHWFWLKP